jgi:mRNA-degrading endonuclease toxin of MazEF toxin-antitoxin module
MGMTRTDHSWRFVAPPTKPGGTRARDIVIVDGRGGAPPPEPKKLRPAIVVQDTDLFDPAYPNLLVVPLTEDAGLAIPDLSVTIDPTLENGCTKPCFALAPYVTAASRRRLQPTASRITPEQLHDIRLRIAEAIGLG